MLIAEESISRNPLLQLPEKNTLDILGTTTIIAQTKIGSNSVNINFFLPIFVDVFCEKWKPQNSYWLIVRGFLLYHLFENILLCVIFCYILPPPIAPPPILPPPIEPPCAPPIEGVSSPPPWVCSKSSFWMVFLARFTWMFLPNL